MPGHGNGIALLGFQDFASRGFHELPQAFAAELDLPRRCNAAAARSKLVDGKFMRQVISTTPGVILSPFGSTIASTGTTLPSWEPCHQRR